MNNCTFGWEEFFALGGILINVWIAIIANSGLTTWKKQATWKARNETAVRILRKCYQIDEAFTLVRNPWIEGREIADAMKAVNKLKMDVNHSDFKHNSMSAVFKQRWSIMNNAYNDMSDLVITSKVYWPDLSVSSKLTELIKLANKLNGDIDLYVTNLKNDQYPVYDPNDPTDGEKVENDILRRMKLQKSVFINGDEDEFSRKIKSITDQLNYDLAQYM